MAPDGRDLDESRRPEDSSREGFITYRRKKRARPIAEEYEVNGNTSQKERLRDIGWMHGEVVNGNRFHWRCNWCGLIRFGGGVSRLKKHIAGVCHVRKCLMVPKDVANAMRNHLLEKQKERGKKTNNHSGVHPNSHLCSDDDLIKREQTVDLDSQEESAAELTKGTTHQDKLTLTRSFDSHKRDREAHKGHAADLAKGENKHGLIFHKTRDSHENVINVQVGRNKRQAIFSHRSGYHRNDIEGHAGNTAGISGLQVGNTTALHEGDHVTSVTEVISGTNEADEILVQRCKNGLSNDMGFQLGTATRCTVGAQGRDGTGFTVGRSRKRKVTVQRSRSRLKSEKEAHMNRVSKLIKKAHFGTAIGLTEEAIRKSKTILQNFNNDHSNGMEACGENATQIAKGFMKQSEGTVHSSRDATEQSNTDEQLEPDIFKGAKDIGNKIPLTNLYKQDQQETINSHWRNILKDTLELPDISQGGGILNCIHDALTCGPVFTRNTGMMHILNQPSLLKNRYVSLHGNKRPDSFINGSSRASGAETSARPDSKINTEICQKLLLEVLCSENFVLLCDLLSENFQDVKAKSFFDFNLINSKMKNGAYEHSPSLFNHDMGQVWEKFINVGRQMVILASSLSNMSQDFRLEKVVEGMVHEADECCEPEGACCVVAEKKKSMEPSQFTFCNSDHSNEPDEIEIPGLCTVFTCKQCGVEGNGEGILICSGCEARYHLSCVDPTIKEIPAQSWYCSACSACNKELPIADVSRMQSDVSQVPRAAMSRMCKICGTFEDKDHKFLVCDNVHCRYKFFHIRCLKGSQIASPQQQSKPWYCPYCLCRTCLTNKDDDNIVCCDGCNEAYHIYCMDPSLSSIPKSRWYCVTCDVAGASEGMKRSEQWTLQQRRKDDVAWSSEVHKSLDLLLRAAETLKQL